MTHPTPTISEIYAKHRAAFIFRTPFGVLLKEDLAYLVNATARDAGASVAEVLREVTRG